MKILSLQVKEKKLTSQTSANAWNLNVVRNWTLTSLLVWHQILVTQEHFLFISRFDRWAEAQNTNIVNGCLLEIFKILLSSFSTAVY